MNAYRVVLKPARAALILFALSVVIAIAVVIGLAHFRTTQEQAIMQTEQQLTDTRDEIRKLTYDLDSINQLAEKYQRLARLGLVGKPDRDAWVENLKNLYRDTRLPPTLRYTLAPAQLMSTQPVPADDPKAYLNNVLFHDLTLELSAIHDVEFLDFMGKLNQEWNAPYRLETCHIAREVAPTSGLQIRCVLQIYSLPEPEKTP
ncbi:MAG: hypothetical protein PHH47_10705 [Gallionella sp.]|nr:hypothetical protein [Gallionella sp.]MDD4947026.1 hypothetical protein [Gallionella sp.]MDD5612609.1 hypothetical protein [Gallionella sp.]